MEKWKAQKATKALSKAQIDDICGGLNEHYTCGHGDIIKHVCEMLENDKTLHAEACHHAIGLFLDLCIIDTFGDKLI